MVGVFISTANGYLIFPATASANGSFAASGTATVTYLQAPGKVAGSYITATVVGSIKTGQLVGDYETALLAGDIKTASLAGDSKTASLTIDLEILQGANNGS
jgi:hypothetical protein